jgi:hypothetical protein
MKVVKTIFTSTVALTIIVLLLVALPASTALADTAGPNYPGSGSDVPVEDPVIGTQVWQNPGYIAADDTLYATATLNKTGRYSHYLQATQYGFAIPADATINGITVVINRQSDHNNPSILDNVVRLVKAGNIVGDNKASTNVWPLSMGTATYGGPTDLWGTTWTPAEINSVNFGLVLAAYRQNNGNNDRIASVDFMQVSVYYTDTTATTTVACGDGAPITYGDNIICVATVTRVTGDQTPSGLVNWTTDGSGTFVPNPCTLSGTDGVATCSVIYTPSMVGDSSHLITANYAGDTYFTPSSGNQTVEVSRKAASVTPNAASKIYGNTDPILSGTLLGFLPADGVTATYSRTAGESVLGSPYTISAILSPAGVLSNYTITYNTANFTITLRPITVTADAKSKTYGKPDPILTYQITSGSLAFEDTFTGALTREAGEDTGSYAILQGTLALSDNYDLTFVGANFTITSGGIYLPLIIR